MSLCPENLQLNYPYLPVPDSNTRLRGELTRVFMAS
jgi:hypothetical protein